MEKNFNIIEYIKDNKGLSGKDIANDLGVSPAFISKLTNGKPIGLEFAKKISNFYGFTLSFVTSGERNEQGGVRSEEIEINNNPSINKENKGVPYFDIDFVGGFDLVFNNNQVKPAFYIDFLPFNDADYWVNVSGKSMGPLIAHGDLVAIKIVEDWKTFLLEGEIYAVITGNGFRTIKMIGAGKDEDHYTLIPYNKSGDYKPQSIPKHVITHVFRVKGAIKKFF